MFDTQKIGGMIAARRKVMGLTQIDFAGKLSVTRQAVSKWERGECLPDITLFPALALVLDVTVSELLGENDAFETRSLQKVESLIAEGRLYYAQYLLRNFDEKTSQWYYLQSLIYFYTKNWSELEYSLAKAEGYDAQKLALLNADVEGAMQSAAEIKLTQPVNKTKLFVTFAVIAITIIVTTIILII